MKLIKTVTLSCALLGCVMFAGTQAHANAIDQDVKIQVNDELIHFVDAEPFIDEHSNLMIPIRYLTDTMGFQLEWSMKSDQVQITIHNQEKAVSLSTENNKAIVNSQTSNIDSKPVFRDGRVYVPFRIIADTFNLRVQWDHDNGIAILDQDGQYHAPAWFAPKQNNEILNTAQQYIGVPYVIGGTTPRGFDCSGFVKFVFANNGIDLPRTSNQMYRTVGVAVDDPQPGDLVFFAEKGTISHVGIFLGDNQYISATTPGNSGGVKVSSLSSSWSLNHYVGMKRVL